MKTTWAPYAAAAAILGAAGLALVNRRESPPEPAPVEQTPEHAQAANGMAPGVNPAAALPPGHPQIGAGVGAGVGAAGPADDPAGAAAGPIQWKVPDGWQTASNPNSMRLATYHPSPTVEVSVSRAGGATDANIDRWVHQFEGAGADKRTDTKVAGFDVHGVEVTGTYSGGGMMPGAAPEAHPGWSLVGVVVETPGPHYFFKMVGPADGVRAARSAFDGMVRSIASR
jgi:hypothetical protein